MFVSVHGRRLGIDEDELLFDGRPVATSAGTVVCLSAYWTDSRTLNAAWADAMAACAVDQARVLVIDYGGDLTLDANDSELICDVANLRIIAPYRARLVNTVLAQGILRVTAGNVEIDGLRFKFEGTKTQISGDYDELGFHPRARASAIYGVDCHGLNVHDCEFDNVVFGLHLASSSMLDHLVRDVRVAANRFIEVDFGVVAVTQQNILIADNRCEDTTRTQNIEPHLIYISGHPDDPDIPNDEEETLIMLPSRGVTIVNNHDHDNDYSSSIKVRNTTGLLIAGNTAINCERGAGVIDSSLVTIRDLYVDMPTSADSQQAGIRLNRTTKSAILNCTIYGQDDVDSCAGIVTDSQCEDTVIRGGRISLDKTAIAGAGNNHIRDHGTNTHVYDVVIENRGSDYVPVSIDSDSVGFRLFNPIIRKSDGGGKIAAIDAAAEGAILTIDTSLLDFDLAANSINDLAVDTKFVIDGQPIAFRDILTAELLALHTTPIQLLADRTSPKFNDVEAVIVTLKNGATPFTVPGGTSLQLYYVMDDVLGNQIGSDLTAVGFLDASVDTHRMIKAPAPNVTFQGRGVAIKLSGAITAGNGHLLVRTIYRERKAGNFY